MEYVSFASAATSFDVLPAIKVQHFYNASEDEHIYTYLKVFVSETSLHLSSTCFEKSPSPTSKTSFLFQTDDAVFLISFSPSGNISLAVQEDTSARFRELFSATNNCYTGEDEQGHYWLLECAIPFEVFEPHTSFSFTVGSMFQGNYLKHWSDDSTYGAFVPAVNLFSTENLAPFEIVAY